LHDKKLKGAVMQQALYEIKLSLQYDIEMRLQEVKTELLQQLESVFDALTYQLSDGENISNSENSLFAVRPEHSYGDRNSSALGEAVEIGAALLGRNASGNTALRRLSGTILRRIGRNIGSEAGGWLFDSGYESVNYGQYQFSEQLLGGLLKAQRNQ
jgi:hypothetical protein